MRQGYLARRKVFLQASQKYRLVNRMGANIYLLWERPR